MQKFGKLRTTANGYSIVELIDPTDDNPDRVVGFAVLDENGDVLETCSTLDDALEYAENLPGPNKPRTLRP